MKRKRLLLLVLAALAAAGAFAQKVGDTGDFMGKNYTVKDIKNGEVTLILTPTLDGTWKGGEKGHTVTISGNTGVFKQLATSAVTQSALKKGFVKVGDQVYRDLKKNGALTWSGQILLLGYKPSAPDICTEVKWNTCTLTLSADGNTFTDNYGQTYTRQ